MGTIGRALGKPPSSVFDVLRKQGGIYAAPRCRAAHCLTLAEREEISRGIVAGCSTREMARRLRRIVAQGLQRAWSPEQIAGWVKAHLSG